jgi:carboxylesterase type B
MDDTVTVSVAQGCLRGREVTTVLGTTYYSFKGIPYAKPPLGYFRFRVSTRRKAMEFRITLRKVNRFVTCLCLVFVVYFTTHFSAIKTTELG